jgi:hypothetical protein
MALAIFGFGGWTFTFESFAAMAASSNAWTFFAFG